MRDTFVVKLSLDTKKFNREAANALRTFDKMTKRFSKPLHLNIAANAFGALFGSLDGLTNKLSLFSHFTQGVFNAIGMLAVQTGQRIASSIFGPLMDGVGEFELQMNSIQTILANTMSKGTTLNQVTSALDELNTYADKTIYNFAEMTQNIGKFTTAGIDLDTSVSAIKGIANLGAFMGATAEQTTRAMYQMSQALSVGVTKLMDWRSIENAGMGGEAFKNSLLETAARQGVKVTVGSGKKARVMTAEQAVDKYGFRDSLKWGWLNNDVMLETLNKFSGAYNESQLLEMGYTKEQTKGILEVAETATDAATKVRTLTQLTQTLKEELGSGWALSVRYIFGDFNEATDLFSNIHDRLSFLMSESSEYRNDQLYFWKNFGGREKLIESLGRGFEGLVRILHSVTLGFEMAFGSWDYNTLLKITDAIETITWPLYKLPAYYANSIRSGTKKVFLWIKSFIRGLGYLVRGFSLVDFSPFIPLIKGLTAVFHLIMGLGEFKPQPFAVFGNALAKLANILAMAGNTIYESLVVIIRILKHFFGLKISFKPLQSFSRAIDKFYNKMVVFRKNFDAQKVVGVPLAKMIIKMLIFKEKFLYVGRLIYDAINKPFTNTKSLFGRFRKNFDEFLSLFDLDEKVKKRANEVEKLLGFGDKTSLTKGYDGVVKKVGELQDGFKSLGGKIKETVGKAHEFSIFFAQNLRELLVGIWKKWGRVGLELFKRAFNKAHDIVTEFITQFLKGFHSFLAIASSLFAVLGNYFFMQFHMKRANIFSTFADFFKNGAKKLSFGFTMFSAETKDLKSTVEEINEIFGMLGSSIKAWQNETNARALRNIAIAILILAASLYLISSIPTDKLATSLAGVTGLIADLVGAAAGFGQLGGLKSTAKLISLAIAIKILAEAAYILSNIEQDKLAGSVAAVLGLLTELSLFMAAQQKGKRLSIRNSVALIILGLALRTFAKAIYMFGLIDPNAAKQGLVILGVVLAEIAAFSRYVKNGVRLILVSAGLVILSVALLMLSNVLGGLATIDPTGMQNALIVMGAVLAEIVAFSRIMPKAGKTLSLAASMLIFATAFRFIGEVIASLAMINAEDSTRALLVLAGILGEIILFSILIPSGRKMRSVKGTIAIFSASIATIAGAMNVLKTLTDEDALRGVLVIGAVLTELALYGKFGSANPVKAAVLLVGILSILLLANALQKLSEISDEGAIKAIALIAAALGILVLAIYALSGAQAGLAMLFIAIIALHSLAKALKKLGKVNIKGALEALLLIGGLIAAIALGGQLLLAAIPGLVVGLAVLAGLGLALYVLGFGLKMLGKGFSVFSIGLALFQATIGAIMADIPGFIDGIKEMALAGINLLKELIPALVELFVAIVKAVLLAIQELIPEMKDTGVIVVKALLDGISELQDDVFGFGWGLLITFLTGIRDNIGEVTTLGLDILQNFIDALNNEDKLAELAQSAVDLVVTLMNTIGNTINNPENKKNIKDAAKNMGGDIIEGIVDGLIEAKDTIANTLNNIMSGIFSGKNAVTVPVGVTGMGRSGVYGGNVPKPTDWRSQAANYTNYNFYQTNTSPKALNPSEIARNTRVLLSTAGR